MSEAAGSEKSAAAERDNDNGAAAQPNLTLTLAEPLRTPERTKEGMTLSLVMEETDESSHDEDEDDSLEDVGMPLFHYSRLFGSLPRQERSSAEEKAQSSSPFSVPCTASIMGKVILSQETTTTDTSASRSSERSITSTDRPAAELTVSADLWQNHPISIAAVGFADGQVWLVDAMTAAAIAGPLSVKEGHHSSNKDAAIVAVSLDASGTFLAAIDLSGASAVWELKYTIQTVRSTVAANTAAHGRNDEQEGQRNVFHNIMSVLTRSNHNTSNENAGASQEQAVDESQSEQWVPALTLASLQVQRITYPKSFGAPACLVLDPAYRRRREKAMMVGFRDGRLVLTKRGMIFQRRNDVVIYQAVKEDDKHFRGIEAIAWRGPLVAWADCSGVRLMDADTAHRIAHVDRPAGARPSLYPTVSQFSPTLCFETSNKLLVAWGDCLLSLNIREEVPSGRSLVRSGSSIANSEVQAAGGTPTTGGPTVIRKRTVECTMAWELECVACGLAPLDKKHVVVLGLVPPNDENADNERQHYRNDVELQVISRLDGEVVYSDLLPLLRRPEKSRGLFKKDMPEPAAPYNLLSSFAVPRMDNAAELQEEGPGADDNFDPLQTSIFSAPESRRTFQDSHLKWNMSQVAFDDEALGQHNVDERGFGRGLDDATDTDSVDSDDYGFVLRPLSENTTDAVTTKLAAAPLMIIVSGSDSVLGRMRNVDDAISFALSQKKPALALRRGLQHIRQLRKYGIRDLVNEYLRSLLRLPHDVSEAEGKLGTRDTVDLEEKHPHLSLRRMKLAAEGMPILLGGDASMWDLWVCELEKIPGALFIVRNFLPVRDPKLPPELYARVLGKMLDEVEEMKASADSDSMGRLAMEAEGHFLNTLVAWGSIAISKEHLRLYQHQADRDPSFFASLRSIKDSLQRRREQTAASYLNLPTAPPPPGQESPPSRSVVSHNDANGTLYNVDDIIAVVSPRISVLTPGSAVSESQLLLSDKEGGHLNSRVALDAMAKLNMMKGRFEDSLRCFLAIGALHAPNSLEEVEATALAKISSNAETKPSKKRRPAAYEYVIFFIESHHLHQCLLDAEFLSDELNSTPLFALIQLAGIDPVGDFLVEHCVAPQQQFKNTSVTTMNRPILAPADKTGGERRGTLPLDLIAEQLEASPKLLYWYLHRLFICKPEIYVKFPNTANPPPIINSLHRKHLDLCIKYAGANRDSAKALEGVEAYRIAEKMTPLLSFLKVVLQLGGIGPFEVAKMLEVERKGGAGVSGTFALELAYIMEHYGDGREDDARLVLELYLKGTKSLMLAVSFAQRARQHSSVLWETLIDDCLSRSETETPAKARADGALFGSLLEAAALSGADLAHLVTQIPTGMAIEGLRPRLVAAVADYRMKLRMHESSADVCKKEKIALLRELGHRSRRGVRYEFSLTDRATDRSSGRGRRGDTSNETSNETRNVLSPTLRPTERIDRYSQAFSLPIH